MTPLPVCQSKHVRIEFGKLLLFLHWMQKNMVISCQTHFHFALWSKLTSSRFWK